MEKLDRLKSLFKNTDKTVYKRCRNCIVMLEKLEDTLTNESRKNIVNKLYAKFRANKLLVKKIVNIRTLKELTEVTNFVYESQFNNKLKYVVGQIVSVDNYDMNLETVCSQGIHYFLTLERAYYHCNNTIKNGLFLMWFDDGQQLEKSNFIDGKLNGKHEKWHHNGQKNVDANYVNNKLDGKYEEWFETGQKKWEKTYVRGKLNGKCESWYENGQKETECDYIENKLKGKRESWYENGQKGIECNYIEGTLNGKFEEWYKNGQKAIECNYIEDKLNGKIEEWHENGVKYVDAEYYYGKCKFYNSWNENGIPL